MVFNGFVLLIILSRLIICTLETQIIPWLLLDGAVIQLATEAGAGVSDRHTAGLVVVEQMKLFEWVDQLSGLNLYYGVRSGGLSQPWIKNLRSTDQIGQQIL